MPANSEVRMLFVLPTKPQKENIPNYMKYKHELNTIIPNYMKYRHRLNELEACKHGTNRLCTTIDISVANARTYQHQYWLCSSSSTFIWVSTHHSQFPNPVKFWLSERVKISPLNLARISPFENFQPNEDEMSVSCRVRKWKNSYLPAWKLHFAMAIVWAFWGTESGW
jgi:hypothetical protein